jgi:hypothetical protein
VKIFAELQAQANKAHFVSVPKGLKLITFELAKIDLNK